MTVATSKGSNILIDSSDVARLLGVGKRRFFLFLKSDLAKNFPKPVQFGRCVNRWVREEVETWVTEEMPRYNSTEDLE